MSFATALRDIATRLGRQLGLTPTADAVSGAAAAPSRPERPRQDRHDGGFAPTPDEVHEVQTLFVRHLRLPLELVDMVLEAAEYFPVLLCGSTTEPRTIGASVRHDNRATGLYFVTEPILPESQEGDLVKPRIVRFRIESHDQGWGGEHECPGTYNGSWTWFDAGILRTIRDDVDCPTHTLALRPRPEDFTEDLRYQGWELVEHGGTKVWRIQVNVCARPAPKVHEIVWKLGHEAEPGNGRGGGKGFVDALRLGDRIAIFANAQFPGWVNNVCSASVEVQYSL